MSLGMTEIILILIVVIVLFGGKKIPELARGLGKAQAEYKKAKETIENEVSEFKQEIVKAAASETKTAKPTKKVATAKKTASTKKTTAAKKTAKTKNNSATARKSTKKTSSEPKK